jgi:glycosyltransferase involved in cell wall biosynthesis
MVDVTIFLNDLGGGGAERVMLSIAEGFAARGYRVDLVSIKRQGAYVGEQPKNVRVIFFNRSRLIFGLWDLVRYLKNTPPKVLLSALQTTNFLAIIAGRLAGGSSRIIPTVHSHVSHDAQVSTRWKRKLEPYLVRLLYPLVDDLIAVSDNVKRDLESLGVEGQKIHRIYNPIVTPKLLAQSKERVHHPWFNEPLIPLLMAVGRLHPMKDYPLLMEAIARVRLIRPVRLIILGEGPQRSDLEALKERLGLSECIALLGFVENPVAYLKAARLLVVSSRWEGFSNVLVEALLVGTPVVSTDCGGPREVLRDGLYGRLVPVNDPEQLAGALLTALDESPNREALIQRAHDFDLDQVMEAYERVCWGPKDPQGS